VIFFTEKPQNCQDNLYLIFNVLNTMNLVCPIVFFGYLYYMNNNVNNILQELVFGKDLESFQSLFELEIDLEVSNFIWISRNRKQCFLMEHRFVKLF